MTSKSIPHNPETPRPPALKQLAFAFPFQRKTQGTGGAPAQFTDEHDIYRILAASERSGSYLVSRNGMWHGGIHITEAGAGQALDLDAGLRCIADGVLIAWRANKDYPVSEVVPGDSRAPFRAPYSTGFALVRHEMEFPRGTKLTFYSLYMHLMSCGRLRELPETAEASRTGRGIGRLRNTHRTDLCQAAADTLRTQRRWVCVCAGRRAVLSSASCRRAGASALERHRYGMAQRGASCRTWVEQRCMRPRRAAMSSPPLPWADGFTWASRMAGRLGKRAFRI
jgi:hypothetical protein